MAQSIMNKAELRKRGVKLTSITEPSDETPSGLLIQYMIDIFSEYQVRNMAVDVARGQRRSAELGFWTSPSIPFGYKRVQVEHGGKMRATLKPDPKTAPLVQRIFRLAGQGRSTLEIAKTLNAEGIANSKKKPWGRQAIGVLLHNEVYTGTNIRGRRSNKDLAVVKAPGAFPQIVTEAEFREVQRKMAEKSPQKQHPRRASSSYLLSGLIKCQTCDRAMNAKGGKSGKHTYYVCHTLSQQGAGSCDTPRLNTKEFEQRVIKALLDSILTEANIRKLIRLVIDGMDEFAGEQQQQLKIVQGELSEVQRRRANLLDAVENGAVAYQDLAERITDLNDTQARLEATKAKCETAVDDQRRMIDNEDRIAAYAKNLSTYLRDSQRANTRELLRSFITEIAVQPGLATIRYKIPMPPEGAAQGKDELELAHSGPVPPFDQPAHAGWFPRTRRDRPRRPPGRVVPLGVPPHTRG